MDPMQGRADCRVRTPPAPRELLNLLQRRPILHGIEEGEPHLEAVANRVVVLLATSRSIFIGSSTPDSYSGVKERRLRVGAGLVRRFATERIGERYRSGLSVDRTGGGPIRSLGRPLGAFVGRRADAALATSFVAVRKCP